MRTRTFGPTGEDVAVVGQGTWKIRDRERAREALEVGLDLGLTHIDTAELYTGAEETIAPVIEDRRDEVFLASKVLPRNAHREGVHDACQASLDRLGTDHLDLYMLHAPSETVPLAETMTAMADLADEGLVRHVGVSNFDVAQLEEAEEALGDVPLACDQVLYHLGDRGIENHVLPYCQRKRIAVVGYSPFGSGNFPPASEGEEGARALQDVADQHDATPHQVALRFLARPDGVFLLPKAEDPAHVRDNAAALELDLAETEVDALDGAFPVPDVGGQLGML